MRFINCFLSLVMSGTVCFSAAAEQRLTVYDNTTFYDGYLVDKIPENAPDEGCNRLYTFLCTKPIPDDVLNSLGESLKMEVNIYPLCDNYDRIGSVNLALIPKGTESYMVNYDESDPMRIEIGRFITPFMNKNRKPDVVPYVYDMDYIGSILRDRDLREKYDFWLELMVFGVPYAAQQQITGCKGCNDVFQGSVHFLTDDVPATASGNNVVVPVTIRTADYRADRGINNYNESCTDEIGKTVKTYTYEVPENCTDGRLVLIMSNHGAGENGEEYRRRNHYVYTDNELSLQFKPGRESCEPFRKYNTQPNGIYGWTPMSDREWQSFSNWCPGDVIDNRLIELGAVESGEHKVRIEVPEAEFYGKDGYFPVSIYFQGVTEGKLPQTSYIADVCEDDYTSNVIVTSEGIIVTAPEEIKEASVYTTDGKAVRHGKISGGSAVIETVGIEGGIYIVAVGTASRNEAHKICLR